MLCTNKVFYGYIVVVAASCIMTIAWGANRTFGVFLKPMLDEFGWSRASISGAFTMAMVIMGGVSIAAGRLSDRFGPRPVLIGAGFFLGLGYVLASQVRSIWQFYICYGGMTGIGLSGAYSPLMSVVARWFVKRRALMSGILTAGAALGIVAMPPGFSLLIYTYGWRTSYLILGSAILSLICSAAIFLRSDPSEMGLLSYGSNQAKVEGLNSQVEGFFLSEAVCTWQFWLLSTIGFCDLFLINAVVVHIVIHAMELGIPTVKAASILSVAAGISFFARIILGGLADKIGIKPACMICLIISTVAFLLLLVARDLRVLYLFAVLYGFSLWAAGPIISLMIAELFGLRSYATILACSRLANSIGGATGPILVGYIFDVTGSYQIGFLICVGVSIMSLLAIIILRPITDQRKTC